MLSDPLQYKFNAPEYAEHVKNLVRIVVNTIDSAEHKCQKVGVGVILHSMHQVDLEPQPHMFDRRTQGGTLSSAPLIIATLANENCRLVELYYTVCRLSTASIDG